MRRYPVWLVNIWLVNRATRHNIVLRLDTCTWGANRFPKGARVLKELGEAVPNAEGRPLRFAGLPSQFAVVRIANYGGQRSASASPQSFVTYLSRANSSSSATAFGQSQVVIILQVEPELRRQTEILPQSNRSISADRSFSPYNLIDARKVQGFCQLICADIHWLHELGFENLSWMDGKDPVFSSRHKPLVNLSASSDNQLSQHQRHSRRATRSRSGTGR
jgi:hypothetical protein